MRFPVSFSQQRLWFLDRLAPGEPTYNMPYQAWLDGPLDADALQRALDTLAERHATFRTSIVAFDGIPEQFVADRCAVPVERIELPASLGRDELTGQAEAIAAERARQPFDLAIAPLIRATLIAAGPGQHLLVLVMHTIISDGASMRILLGELSAAYRAEVTGVPPALPELWMDYGDYAVWQRDRMRGEALDRQLHYWRGRLRGIPLVSALPTDHPRPARQSSRGAVATATVDAATTRRLAEVAHGASATMSMLFLTGFAAVLWRYGGHDDLVIGTQVAGRTHRELDPIIGLLANTVPLRMSLAGDPTFAGLLGQARDVTVDAMAHQEAPFEKLVGELAAQRSLGYSPLVQVQFVYGSLTPPSLDLPGVTARPVALTTGTAKLDLTMHADAGDDQETTLALEYSTDLFGPAWADRFLRRMVRLLEHAADTPGTPVADLPLLSGEERGALVAGHGGQEPAGGDADPRWREDGSLQMVGRRAALPAPAWGGQAPAASHVRPRSPVEATLARIWGDLLGTDAPVGVHDNLFALGGHSLTATRLVARVADTYGVSLPVHQVFSGPTIAELAEAISADPDFGRDNGAARHAELAALSDEDLNALLRAVVAQRNRRQATADGPDS